MSPPVGGHLPLLAPLPNAVSLMRDRRLHPGGTYLLCGSAKLSYRTSVILGVNAPLMINARGAVLSENGRNPEQTPRVITTMRKTPRRSHSKRPPCRFSG